MNLVIKLRGLNFIDNIKGVGEIKHIDHMLNLVFVKTTLSLEEVSKIEGVYSVRLGKKFKVI